MLLEAGSPGTFAIIYGSVGGSVSGISDRPVAPPVSADLAGSEALFTPAFHEEGRPYLSSADKIRTYGRRVAVLPDSRGRYGNRASVPLRRVRAMVVRWVRYSYCSLDNSADDTDRALL
jgi:hypothetical protein